MPIKGLTDGQAAFPEIGRIRKGAPKNEEGHMGKDLSYFRAEFDEAEVGAANVFLRAYGDKPDELNILLPFNSVDENFEAWREIYVAGGLVHRCDGERIWYQINPATGEKIVTNGEPYKECDGSSCKPTGRLKIIIPELQRLAYLTVLTGSIHDILNISQQLEALLQINGKLAGVPLILRRRPREISTPSGKDGKRARRTKYLLSIEADPEWVKHKLASMKAAALPGNGLPDELPALEAPEDTDEDWTAEEMDSVVEGEYTEAPKEESKGRVIKKGTANIAQQFVDSSIAENVPNAAAILNRIPQSIKTDSDKLKWGKLYRGFRDQDNGFDDAVELANKGMGV